MTYSQTVLGHRKLVLKVPPFGNQIDTDSTVFIHMGGRTAWSMVRAEYKRGTRRALVLPDGNLPSYYRWPVSGRDIIVIDHTVEFDELYYKKLAFVLLRQGSVGLIVIHKASISSFRYVREGARYAA